MNKNKELITFTKNGLIKYTFFVYISGVLVVLICLLIIKFM